MLGRVDRDRERSRLGKEAAMWLSRLVCSRAGTIFQYTDILQYSLA